MMRKLTVSNCTIAAAILLLIGCETDRREAGIHADTAAIKTVSEQAAEAWTAGDWNTFAEFYTDDTIWMPPAEAPIRGIDALRTWVGPIWNDSTVVEISMTSEEIVVIDDWAFERHFESLVQMDEINGESKQYYLKGARIFRREEDGSWKIAQYIWNENVPPD
jgi:uncharacterized protein (TIGR02246 family)